LGRSLLQQKPTLEVQQGKIEPVERIRTKHKAIQRAFEIVAEQVRGKSSIQLAVTHANSKADALALLESARNVMDPVETMICPISPVIDAHVGPGTVALSYMSGIS
jgi:fatty acid-binding protein DegV